MKRLFLYMIFKKIIAATQKNKDKNRRQFILNVLLCSSIILLIIAQIVTIAQFIIFKENYIGTHPLVIFFILIFFVFLFYLSKKGQITTSASLFILLCLAPSIYMSITWGPDLPQALLFYILIIVMSGVLINNLFSFLSLVGISIFLAIIHYLNYFNIIAPNLYWKNEQQTHGDIALVLITFFIVFVVSWLSNRETEKSLRRARTSEIALKKERDSLEIKVQERTEELKKAQIEKMTQLYRFAEFGRLSSGIFHDLINPMTVVSLNLERLKDMQQKEVTDARSHLSQAFAATKRMEEFIISLRKQLQKENTKSHFSMTEEIIQTIQMLSYRARKAQTDILFSPLTKDIKIFGDSIRFSQIIMNLVSNAIDSYDNTPIDNKKVEVELLQKNNEIVLTVKDYGCGIDPKNLEKIFDPFFTTKKGSSDKGMGIGLSSTKNIIEKDFTGTIKIESEINTGTTFIISFPQII